MRMSIQQTCPCGGSIKVDGDVSADVMEQAEAWRQIHKDHGQPSPPEPARCGWCGTTGQPMTCSNEDECLSRRRAGSPS